MPCFLVEVKAFSQTHKLFIRSNYWTTITLSSKFHERCTPLESSYHYGILQIKNSNIPPHSLASGQATLSEIPARGNRSFFPESERGDGLFISFQGPCRMQSCLCGRLPVIKEEWITGYAQTLSLQRSAKLMK